jgi:hypothetical protein
MTGHEYPEEFIERLKAVTSKRARIVIEHILEHGFITTEDLETKYGYKHPPRAARDVRERGIPLETFSVKNAEGRTIAAYRFADPSQVHNDKLAGRKVIPKKFKQELIKETDSCCSICLERYETRHLQVDHRIPYEISGDTATVTRKHQEYMLLCGSCNRAKSWSCEHCTNWLEVKSPEICQACYWAHPESYKHIALRIVRRLDITWTEHEIAVYEKLKQRAEIAEESMPDYVKAVIRNHLGENE